jgi:hypothetical protein
MESHAGISAQVE